MARINKKKVLTFLNFVAAKRKKKRTLKIKSHFRKVGKWTIKKKIIRALPPPL